MPSHVPGSTLLWSEIFVPVACFTVLISFQAYEFRKKEGGTRVLFSKVREGWVQQNFLTGQAAANTTRDYLRVTTFFANVAVVLSVFLLGTAGTLYSKCQGNSSCSTERTLLVIKLGCLSGLLLAIFFLYSQSTRYALHLHFMMNCKYIDGKLQPYIFMVRLFDRAHWFYSLGMRFWFAAIPVAAWLFSQWFLLAITPFHMLMVHSLETDAFMRSDLRAFDAIPAPENKTNDIENGRELDAGGAAPPVKPEATGTDKTKP